MAYEFDLSGLFIQLRFAVEAILAKFLAIAKELRQSGRSSFRQMRGWYLSIGHQLGTIGFSSIRGEGPGGGEARGASGPTSSWSGR